MTNFWTKAQIVEKIQRDLDLEDESFIVPDELDGYINEAIDDAEAEIHTLYEDYFLTRDTVTLISGTESYGLPSDIYANKIRRVVYVNGSRVYDIPRFRDWHKFEVYRIQKTFGSGEIYGYMLINDATLGTLMLIAPTPVESGPYIERWYLRSAKRLVDDTDVCDIPEFVTFVIQYAKVKCYEKEGHPGLDLAVQKLEQYREQMTSTLAAMVPDADNQLEADYTHYWDHS